MLTGVLTVSLAGCVNVETREKKEQIVLTILAGQSTSDAGIEDMIDEWAGVKYPGVKLEWECVDWGDQFDAQMRGRLAAGDVPDIVIGKAQDVKLYAKTGQLGTVTEKCSEKIKENALDPVTMDGKVYGLPYNFWYQGVIYNKDIFERYGLKPPTTPQEMDSLIEDLEAVGIVPFAAHFQESWKVANMTMQYMMNDIFKYSPRWGDQLRAGVVNCTGNEKMLACMLNNQKILNASWDDALLLNQFESDSRFTQGDAAMYLTGSWSMQFANQYGKTIKFGIFPFPNEEGEASLIRETNLTLMKSADTKYSNLIDEIFYSLLSDKKLAREILDFTQSDSAVKGLEAAHNSKIQEDIRRYETEGNIIDVSAGNAQLIWSFQNSAAQEQLSWLKGEKTSEEVLEYMDENREDSAYTE
ncbi:Multiple sugar-binding protein precursor [Clostridium sp. C105KSO13]|nr:Multiple sugar-binding protein precursor [Clostridium sp. C105KSO13]